MSAMIYNAADDVRPIVRLEFSPICERARDMLMGMIRDILIPQLMLILEPF
jgi:hypothetical protein